MFSGNIAYNQKTNHISTVTNSSNAVDEKNSTYFRTEPEKNPWIEVNLDKIQRVKYIYITLLAGEEIYTNK